MHRAAANMYEKCEIWGYYLILAQKIARGARKYYTRKKYCLCLWGGPLPAAHRRAERGLNDPTYYSFGAKSLQLTYCDWVFLLFSKYFFALAHTVYRQYKPPAYSFEAHPLNTGNDSCNHCAHKYVWLGSRSRLLKLKHEYTFRAQRLGLYWCDKICIDYEMDRLKVKAVVTSSHFAPIICTDCVVHVVSLFLNITCDNQIDDFGSKYGFMCEKAEILTNSQKWQNMDSNIYHLRTYIWLLWIHKRDLARLNLC